MDGLRVEIGADGRLRVGTRTVASAKALPDARIAIDGSRAVVLGDPTDRYRHGVLGDGHEARSALVLDLAAASVLARIEPPRGWVLEGIAPILADLDGDGVREIVLTESAEGEGARLAAYRRDASLAGASAPIGRGYRWRHQIAVGATRPGGPPELVSVRTPHLGGIAEYFRLDAGRLVQVAAYRGVSSHAIGSRNLDAAALADWDGDGGLELLVPNLAHDALVVVSRTRDGAEEQTRLAAGGRIATNLAGAIAGGVLHVGFGTGDGRLRLWGLLHSRTE